MFDFILKHENFLYFDPYRFEQRDDFIFSRGNGIHLANHVAIFMTMDIMNHAQHLYLGTRGTDPWPLRPSLRARVENYYSR